MNFAVAAGCHSSRAVPFLRDTPAATYYTTIRQRLHLSTAKRCADKAGHLTCSQAKRHIASPKPPFDLGGRHGVKYAQPSVETIMPPTPLAARRDGSHGVQYATV